ncbi:MAG: sugar transferase [Bacilli bacterium]|nr:sugar transferase [Bacilli bacterium]
MKTHQKIYIFFKTILGFFFSFLAILLIGWFMLIIALTIKIDSEGPVLFKQDRIGKNKKIFKVYKFRTMKTDTPDNIPTHMLDKAESHITKVGKFLRRTSLDELPQLLNILKGQMAFVGPRPALYNQDDLVALRDQYNANSVKPGITGLAQVKGRDELPIDVKAKYDGEYVKKISLWFDIKILFMTVFAVFTEKGVKEGKN